MLIALATAPIITVNPHIVAAQPASERPAADDNQLLKSYYKDPRPERLIGFMERLQKRTELGWNAYVAPAGFFAVVFRKNPNRAEQLIPPQLTDRSADALRAALLLSGDRRLLEKLRPRLESAGSDLTLKAAFDGLPPRLENLTIKTATHLDLLWGAAFASGDERYVRMIVDFFARAANQSEPAAIDIAMTVVALTGGANDILPRVKAKYSDQGFRDVVVAATALWAIMANAREHPFVASVRDAYVRDNPDAPATKALRALQPKPQR